MNSGVFERYAQVYDDVYREKDYFAECDFLQSVFYRWSQRAVKRILDLGCGTGSHALELGRRGFEVLGIDRSANMLAVARHKSVESGLCRFVHFSHADACDWQPRDSFDVVISMFAVLSYQITDGELQGLLRTARNALTVGGLFVADFWFGPAVVVQRPENRTKFLTTSSGHAIRTCTPRWEQASSTVHISYQVLQFERDATSDVIQETHSLRYFSLPELRDQLTASGLELVHVCAFPRLYESPSEHSWNVALVARAIEKEPRR